MLLAAALVAGCAATDGGSEAASEAGAGAAPGAAPGGAAAEPAPEEAPAPAPAPEPEPEPAYAPPADREERALAAADVARRSVVAIGWKPPTEILRQRQRGGEVQRIRAAHPVGFQQPHPLAHVPADLDQHHGVGWPR